MVEVESALCEMGAVVDCRLHFSRLASFVFTKLFVGVNDFQMGSG